MNPHELFCPNMDCPARGQVGKENIQVHSQKAKRCICEVCGQTCTTTTGTLFYRLRSDPHLGMWVIVLLAYGCPGQAIVKAFGLDERTVCDWHKRASIANKSMNIGSKAVSMIYNKGRLMKSKSKYRKARSGWR